MMSNKIVKEQIRESDSLRDFLDSLPLLSTIALSCKTFYVRETCRRRIPPHWHLDHRNPKPALGGTGARAPGPQPRLSCMLPPVPVVQRDTLICTNP